VFDDRRDAGRELAGVLVREIEARDRGSPVVLGLARGGVPVAAEVADQLGAPLDVLIVRKLGVPWQPELGVGAIAEGGVRVLNDALIAEIGLDRAAIDEVTLREQRELERRVQRYRGDRPPVPVKDRTAIVVDDGLATGYTAWAAIESVRSRGAARVILAVPVAPPDSVATLGKIADRVIAVTQPAFFMAIGEFYRDFSQTSDVDVVGILDAHRSPPTPA
jgi:predicted phosphoribosyltransferase